MKKIKFIIFSLLLISCEQKKIQINQISDLRKFGHFFGVKNIEQVSSDFGYLLTHDIKFDKDSLIAITSYSIEMDDESNVRVDEIRFSSENYCKFVETQINEVVKISRSTEIGLTQKKMGLIFIYDRAFNFCKKGLVLYILGFDAQDIKYHDSNYSLVKGGRLKKMDIIVNSLNCDCK